MKSILDSLHIKDLHQSDNMDFISGDCDRICFEDSFSPRNCLNYCTALFLKNLPYTPYSSDACVLT